MKKDSRQTGFTLMELMITVAIIGIIAAVAIPSYQQYIQRSNRAAAQAAMMDIANRQQQFLLANRAYATSLSALGYTAPGEVSARYTISDADNIAASTFLDSACAAVADTGTLPSFVITFAPFGSQASDGTLRLSSTGVKCPANKW
jgi:type IV pilus assembly protein PilE